MRARIDTWLPWVLAAVALLLVLISGAFVAGVDSGLDIFISALALAFSGIGALIARKHPRNAIGWLLAFIGMLGALNALARAYAVRGLASDPGSLAVRADLIGAVRDTVRPAHATLWLWERT